MDYSITLWTIVSQNLRGQSGCLRICPIKTVTSKGVREGGGGVREGGGEKWSGKEVRV